MNNEQFDAILNNIRQLSMEELAEQSAILQDSILRLNFYMVCGAAFIVGVGLCLLTYYSFIIDHNELDPSVRHSKKQQISVGSLGLAILVLFVGGFYVQKTINHYFQSSAGDSESNILFDHQTMDMPNAHYYLFSQRSPLSMNEINQTIMPRGQSFDSLTRSQVLNGMNPLREGFLKYALFWFAILSIGLVVLSTVATLLLLKAN